MYSSQCDLQTCMLGNLGCLLQQQVLGILPAPTLAYWTGMVEGWEKLPC